MALRLQLPFVFVFLSVIVSPELAQGFAPVSIAITETGQPPTWTVAVDGRRGNFYLNIVAPDGSVLEPDVTPFERWLPAGSIEFEETFGSLESALSFVNGNWTTTEVTSLLSDRAETFNRQFTVNELTSDDLNRSVPILSSPVSGFEAKNGEAFLLAWEYETMSGDEEPNLSVITRRRTSPEERGFSRSIRTTPSGGSSGIGSSGAADFNTSLRAEPGADTNRWLLTVTSNQHLPQTFDIQVGSWLELDEFLVTPLQDPDNPDRGPYAELSYSRLAETVNVSLVSSSVIEFACEIPDGVIAGDFDGNGAVEFADFLTLSGNFGQIVSTHEEGDTDCDNFVGFSDFLALSENFGKTAATSATAVPEPSTVGLAICSVLVLCHRRRHIALLQAT